MSGSQINPEGSEQADGLLLFVYGSLKRGHQYSGYLQGQTFVGEAILAGYRLLCFGDYPAIIPDDLQGSRVKGELYQVSAEVIAAVDELEGDEYERLCVKVEVGEQTECALVYVASDKLLRSKNYQRLSGVSWDRAPREPL